MKKSIFLLLVILLTLFSCQKKAVPVITSRTPEQPPPAKKVLDIKPDMEIGKVVFTNRCSRCHDLPKPAQFTAQRWEGILSYMIPRARLDDEQAVHLTAYMKANAAK